jgi:hypothetical protein
MDGRRRRFGLLERVALGWHAQHMGDLDRIGGWGRGFSLVTGVGFSACATVAIAATLLGLAGERGRIAGATHFTSVVLSCLLVLLAWLVIRLNRSGVYVESEQVRVVNPRGTHVVAIDEIVELTTTRSGLNWAFRLADGSRLTIWGIGWWAAFYNALTSDGIAELRERLGRQDPRFLIESHET